ncbi:MAG: hypothetical protein KGH61_00235 [Candidatus Micrarchaeota archaeon]|nr:hypothetical protein [Candidatus Micrarchaeota archaeon]MDE1847364.1 hypothetical protein [Candidatus Micrarchaeota archaeon]MDE1863979.1 hypothetical protein [Candidatus Micrarchaeota archaeon]
MIVADIRDATELLHTSYRETPSKRQVVDDILDATQLLRIGRMVRRRA